MEFLMVSQVLGLQEDFSHLNIYPNHICGQCKQTVISYKSFKEEAIRNETFVMQNQDDIKQLGLVAAQAKHKTVTKEAHKDDISSNEENIELKEYFDKEVVFSFKDEEIDFKEEAIDLDDDFEEQDYGRNSLEINTVTSKCKVCDNSFKDLAGHMRRQHPEVPPEQHSGVCTLCGKEFRNLEKHNKRLHTSIKCSYPDCDFVLKNVKHYRDHIRYRHETKTYKNCQKCGVEVK